MDSLASALASNWCAFVKSTCARHGVDIVAMRYQHEIDSVLIRVSSKLRFIVSLMQDP